MPNLTAAYGMYGQRVGLNDVLNTFIRAGFHKDKVCMMLSPAHPIAGVVREANILNADRRENAATANLIGWLSEFGAVVIPTVGFFIRSREFFHAILVENGSMARCGTSRMLEGLGFSEREAARIDRELRAIGTLIYLSCPATRTTWALEVLRETGATNVNVLGENEATLPVPIQPKVALQTSQLAASVGI